MARQPLVGNVITPAALVNQQVQPSAAESRNLFEAWKQEGIQAGGAGVDGQAGDVLEEAGAQLPLPVVQERDGRRQQEVVALPASQYIAVLL